MFLLLLFSILMLIASFKMIRRIERPRLSKDGETNYTILVSQGLLVGIITGLIGAGGGFLIVPALVMLLGLNMKRAVATSLFIIAMNSTLGFLSTMKMVKHDWTFGRNYHRINRCRLVGDHDNLGGRSCCVVGLELPGCFGVIRGFVVGRVVLGFVCFWLVLCFFTCVLKGPTF